MGRARNFRYWRDSEVITVPNFPRCSSGGRSSNLQRMTGTLGSVDLTCDACRRSGVGAVRKSPCFQYPAQPAHAAADVQHRVGGIAGKFQEQLGVALAPRHVRQTDVFRPAGGIVEVAIMEKIAGQDLGVERQLRVGRVPMGLAVFLQPGRLNQMAGTQGAAEKASGEGRPAQFFLLGLGGEPFCLCSMPACTDERVPSKRLQKRQARGGMCKSTRVFGGRMFQKSLDCMRNRWGLRVNCEARSVGQEIFRVHCPESHSTRTDQPAYFGSTQLGRHGLVGAFGGSSQGDGGIGAI